MVTSPFEHYLRHLALGPPRHQGVDSWDALRARLDDDD